MPTQNTVTKKTSWCQHGIQYKEDWRKHGIQYKVQVGHHKDPISRQPLHGVTAVDKHGTAGLKLNKETGACVRACVRACPRQTVTPLACWWTDTKRGAGDEDGR